MVNTQIIVLRKQPYQESALLLTGISPDCGKLSLLAHGAQKIGEKNFPEADLFRELQIDFEPSEKSDLQILKNLELQTAFDGIAEKALSYKMAGKISAFLLANIQPDLPQPFTYDALKSVFTHLAAAPGTPGVWDLMQCSVVLKITYLYENGLLPENGDEKSSEFLENLVAAGIENDPLPECSAQYWKSLNDWLSSLIAYHQLRMS